MAAHYTCDRCGGVAKHGDNQPQSASVGFELGIFPVQIVLSWSPNTVSAAQDYGRSGDHTCDACVRELISERLEDLLNELIRRRV